MPLESVSPAASIDAAPMEPSRKKFPSLAGAVGLLLFSILVQILMLLGLVAYNWIVHQNFSAAGMAASLPIFILTYLVTFGSTVLLGWRLTREPFRTVFRFTAFSYKIIPWFISLLLGLAVVLFETMAVVTLIKPVSPWLMELMRRLMEQSVPLALLAGGILGPFLEEMLFRGLVLRGFLHRYSPWQAIVLSSLLFGILHLNIWQFVSAFVLGLVLGWMYMRTRSLWPCFILHSLHNSSITLTGTLIYASLLGYPEEVVEATVMPLLPWWLVVAGVALLAFSLLAIHRLLLNWESAAGAVVGAAD
ncbi:MAG TPA: type II CAAX endopeptidase family protein [bacterium]|nr:type II CAAX endopeptidase family protein [bacterium]HPN34736.1 type II CAAX endopeptidase family protein [bacterium]